MSAYDLGGMHESHDLSEFSMGMSMPMWEPARPAPSTKRGKRRAVARRRSRSRSVSRERRGSTVRERRDKRPQTAWTEPASGDDGDAATAAAPAAALPAPAPASSALPPLTRIQLRPETARLPSDKTESFLHGYGATGESDTEENEEAETTAPPRGRSPSRFNNSLLRTLNMVGRVRARSRSRSVVREGPLESDDSEYDFEGSDTSSIVGEDDLAYDSTISKLTSLPARLRRRHTRNRVHPEPLSEEAKRQAHLDFHRPLGTNLNDQKATRRYMAETLESKAYGVCYFSNDGAPGVKTDRAATFTRIWHTSAPEKLIELLTVHLKYSLPRLVISVTGGARNFRLPPKLETVVRAALRQAVTAADAWVISGGSNCGIMQFIGRAVREIQTSMKNRPRIPCIAFATWKKIPKEWRRKMKDKDLGAYLRVPGENEFSALDPNHSHYFLVEDGVENKFQREIGLRNRFEAALRRQTFHNLEEEEEHGGTKSKIQNLLLVIEGGIGTLDTVVNAVERDTAVLVIENSGRVADLLAYAWRMLHDERPGARFFSRAELLRRVRNLNVDTTQTSYDTILAKVFRCVVAKHKISLFSLEASQNVSSEDIGNSMLRSIITSMHSRTGSPMDQYELRVDILRLAMAFGHIDLARDQQYQMQRLVRVAEGMYGRKHADVQQLRARYETDIEMALMYALTTNKPELVEYLFSKVTRPAEFLYANQARRLRELYDLRFNREASEYFPILAPDLMQARREERAQARVVARLSWEQANLLEAPPCPLLYDVMQRLEQAQAQLQICAAGTVYQLDLLVHRLLFGRLRGSVGQRQLQQLAEEAKTAPGMVTPLVFHDLMVWACLMNHFRLAHFFWRRCNHPVANALLSARLFHAMSQHYSLINIGHLHDTVTKMARMGDKFEALAMGVLDACFDEDSELTQLVLREPLNEYSELLSSRQNDDHSMEMNAIELARITKDLRFVAHSACQAVTEKEWRGRLRSDISTLLVLFNLVLWMASAFVPVLHLLLAGPRLVPMRIDIEEEDNEIHQDRRIVCERCQGIGEHASLVARRRGVGTEADKTEGNDDGSGEGEDEDDEPAYVTCQMCGGKGWQPRAVPTYERFSALVSAPVTKFWLDAIFFVGLLALYSSILLLPYEEQLTWMEILLIIWMAVLVLEELREMYPFRQRGFRLWIVNPWHQLDLSIFVGFAIALAIRLVAISAGKQWWLQLSKVFFAVNIIQVFLRLLRYYSISTTLGPKVIIMYRMVKHLATFGALLVVFMLGYGIASYALLFPDTPFEYTETFKSLLLRPYFHIYGELFLSEIEADTACVGQTLFSSCNGSYGWLAVWLLAIYMVVANLMLVNLLIAMFTTAYEDVEGEAMEHFRLQFLQLVTRYRHRTVLPAPLTIIELAVRLILVVYASCFREPSFRQSRFNRRSEEVTNNTVPMRLFQCRHRDNFAATFNISSKFDENSNKGLQMTKMELRQMMEAVIRDWSVLQERMEQQAAALNKQGEPAAEGCGYFFRSTSVGGSVSIMCNDEDDEGGTSEVYETSPDRVHPPLPYHERPENWFKVEVQEEGVTRIIMYSNKPADNVSEVVTVPAGPEERLLVLDLFEFHSIEWDRRERRGESPFTPVSFVPHVLDKHRQSVPVRRIPVSAPKQSWDVDFPEYDPPTYTAPYNLVHSKGTPCINTPRHPADACTCAKWGAPPDVDPANPVMPRPDGVPFTHDAKGFPLNPKGRTGLRGRGLLGSWGPNRAIDEVVTRWKRDRNGVHMRREGKCLLEVVVVKRNTGSRDWALPGAFALNSHPARLKAFSKDRLKRGFSPQEEDFIERQTINFFEQQGTPVYEGFKFMNDPRNTDHAWIVSHADHFHDSDGTIFDSYDLKGKTSAGVLDVAWATVHCGMPLYADHTAIVELVAKNLGAFW